MSKQQVSRKGLQYLMAILAIVSAGLFTSATAASPIRAPEGATFWGIVDGASGQRLVCWRGFAVNAIGDFGGSPWFHPLRDNATISDGCTPIFGDGSYVLYLVPDLAKTETRQSVLVVTTPPNGDGLNGKLLSNTCRTDDSGGRGSKLLFMASPNDGRCVK